MIPDTGADASAIPWSNCERLALDPGDGIPGLMSNSDFSYPATPTPLGFLPSFHLIRSIQHRLWNRHSDLLRCLEINH